MQAVFVSFEEWTRQRSLPYIGTNAGANRLPFQRWRHFKEAFAPEIVRQAVTASPLPVLHCIDPFGGSGTTGLACQFLGIHPTSIEINPYLADLIEAKLTSYNIDSLIRDLGNVLRRAACLAPDPDLVRSSLPDTYVEPGVGRWLFDRQVAARIWALRTAIEALPEEAHVRLFKVLLGGILLDASNVVVNGKGRRYRSGWETNRRSAESVEPAFAEAVANAIAEIDKFAARRTTTFNLLRGDARSLVRQVGPAELAVFSPPYPNSFDYTDVYNIELWMLGYLNDAVSNNALRQSTLASHVQIHRNYSCAPQGSFKLASVLESLDAIRSSLWNRHIPEMIGAYFAEVLGIMRDVEAALCQGGAMWIVIGDSRYGHVAVKTAEILAELAESATLRVESILPFRQMRASAQQGGKQQLAESLLVMRRV